MKDSSLITAEDLVDLDGRIERGEEIRVTVDRASYRTRSGIPVARLARGVLILLDEYQSPLFFPFNQLTFVPVPQPVSQPVLTQEERIAAGNEQFVRSVSDGAAVEGAGSKPRRG
jgi:hypothetical protein